MTSEQPVFGDWRNETVDGQTCDIFEPQTLNEHGYVVIYLHGVHLGRLRHSQAYVTQLERFGLPCVAPNSERSWWTDRICPEFDANRSAQQYLLESVLPFAQERFGVRPPRIGLFGTSMGGQGALRLAYKFPQLFPIVAAASPAIDYQDRMLADREDYLWRMYDSAESARRDTATEHVQADNAPPHQLFCCCPEDTSWWPSSDRLRKKLHELGVPFECDLETRGGGHGFRYYSLMAPRIVEFLASSLDKQRLAAN